MIYLQLQAFNEIGAGLPSMSPDPRVACECHHLALRSWPPVCPSWSTSEQVQKSTRKAQSQRRLAETSSFTLQLLTHCPLFRVLPSHHFLSCLPVFLLVNYWTQRAPRRICAYSQLARRNIRQRSRFSYGWQQTRLGQVDQ